MLKLVAPEVGGVEGLRRHLARRRREARRRARRSSSTPSRSCPPKEGAALLATLPAARDFVADATAHRKFIAYAAAAAPLLEKAGVAEPRRGLRPANKAGDCDGFVAACRKLRFWDRAAAER